MREGWSLLNDFERLVSHCIVMRLLEHEALLYLEANGHKCGKSTYWKTRSKIKATIHNRINEIAAFGFEDQHIERIDTLEWVHQELVRQYLAQGISPGTKARILQQIAEIQPYLAGFYRATKMVANEKAEPTL